MIGKRIKQRRKELGMSQDDLAMLLKYDSRATISKIESGIIDISVSKVPDIAKALGTSVSYLMGWEETEEEEVNNIPPVIAAHFDGEMTDEDVDEINSYIEYYLSKKKNKK